MPRWQRFRLNGWTAKVAHSSLFQRGLLLGTRHAQRGYQDYDATASGVKRGEELAEQAVICGVTPAGPSAGCRMRRLHSGAYLMKVRAYQYDTVDGFAGVITGARRVSRSRY